MERELCFVLKDTINYFHYKELAPSKNWPLSLDLKCLPARISSLARDLLRFFTDATLLQGNLIWQEMMERQEGDLKELASRTWNGDELRAARPG